MSGPAGGGVFISYRRRESSGITGRLYDRLAGHFGDAQVFMDVDTIAPGVDFTKVIAQAVSNCTVLLAVIGPGWLTATDEDGERRLEDPDDLVRLEIQAALERDIRVIPILVEGAVMPRGRQLPEELAGLARRNAISLRHESFRSDADRLLEAIEPILASAGASQAAPGPAQVEPAATDPAEVATGGQTGPKKPGRQAREDAARQAREAEERRAQEEADRKAREDAARQAREETDPKAQAGTSRQTRKTKRRQSQEGLASRHQEDAELPLLLHRARSAEQAGDKAGARSQYLALLPIQERVYGAESQETLDVRWRILWLTMLGGTATAADMRDQAAAVLPILERVDPASPRIEPLRKLLAFEARR
jgi:hypothetical protein